MKKYKKEVYRTREEWLKARGIGGSEAGALIGKSKWLTANDVYNRLIGREKKIRTNERMVEGTLAEEHIRALWALDHKDLVVKKPPKKGSWLFRRKDEPMMTCTPDGLVYDKTKNLYGLEIKDCELIKKEDKEMWETGYLPDQYYCQLLWYLVVMSDMQGVYLTAHLKYFKNENNKWVFDYAIDKTYYVDRNEVINDIKYLEEEGKSFIHNNYEKRIRPKITLKI